VDERRGHEEAEKGERRKARREGRGKGKKSGKSRQ
jgi:hypothetical protein